ncbi:alkaline phosphatase-like [Coccinella septempunctata]|uniref:alkaline phosphatase-like n=1 Tax=Coccinella septempunctata TaxID=41139 RepID=UPI001D09598A|nr:alkaline phosphatase-like [Coccinella septempunctata]
MVSVLIRSLTSSEQHSFFSDGIAFGIEELLFNTGPDSKVSDIDGQPYTTILYGNGPGFAIPRIVPMNTTTATEDKNQVHGSAVPRQWGTHGGEDVPVYALGPLATILFTGTFDQSYIPHAIAYSACLGEHRLRCQGLDNYTAPQIPTCVGPDLSNVPGVGGSASGSGAPVVVASSVKADDSGSRTKSGAADIFSLVFHLLCLSIGLNFAVT